MDVLKNIWAELLRRGRNLLICGDQLLGSVVSFGDAYPDETPSSYVWRLEGKGRFFGVLFRAPIDWFFFILLGQEDHCQKSYEKERTKFDSPEEFRCAYCMDEVPLMNGSTDTEVVIK